MASMQPTTSAGRPAGAIPAAFVPWAERNLPRYTSYPTALAFHSGVGEAQARAWAAEVRPDDAISVYVHVPFCDQLCWYCGCHTSVPNGYSRIADYQRRLHLQIDSWARALAPHAGARHLHFGGGSPNALSPSDFVNLARRLRDAFHVLPAAEVAVELDPRSLDAPFFEAIAASGVNRASLGVQTLDPLVQRKVNRIQPLELIAHAAAELRRAGVEGLNFDLMYGLPGQTPDSAAGSATLAAGLRPDRLSVFGYAHVPWFKKHQKMIQDEDLAGLEGRWAQAVAIDEVLVGQGYRRIGLDHYALPDDPLTSAAREGRLRRNFQGYTLDTAETLVPIGLSAIGRFRQGYVQNNRSAGDWALAVDAGELAVDRGVEVTAEDRLRAEVIERLMCDLEVDVGALCKAHGFEPDALDASIERAAALTADGIAAVKARLLTIPAPARRLMRAVAACFDAALTSTETRHSRAV